MLIGETDVVRSNCLWLDVFLPFESFSGVRLLYDDHWVYEIHLLKGLEHNSSFKTNDIIPKHVASVCRWFDAYALGCTTKPQVECYQFKWQCSPFAQSVLTSLMDVPFGRVLTYGELAKKSGHDGAARAVGHVMACNPFPIIIPCHRVFSKSRPWLYAFGEEIKQELLKHEDVCISQLSHKPNPH